MPVTVTLPIPVIKNWKTTAFGVLSLALGIYQASHATSIMAAVQDPKVQSEFLVALIGFFAKDYNVTGGTVAQASTVQAVVDSGGTAGPMAVVPTAPASAVTTLGGQYPPLPKAPPSPPPVPPSILGQ
jgi:hypothetical protein